MTTATDYKTDLSYDILKIAIHGGLENGKLESLFSLAPERFDKLALREIFSEAKSLYNQKQPITTATLACGLRERLKGRPLLDNIIELLLQMEVEKDEAVYLSGHIQTYLKQFTESNETADFDITKALKIGSELQELNIPIRWAAEGLIPKEAITLLSARGGMGKTIFSISIADAVSKGIPYLTLETTKMQVVYIDFENSLPTLIERIKRIDASNVLFWHPTNEIKPPRLDSKEYALYKKLPEGSLLIFDTLRASQSKDENDSQHMAMIMQRLKELRDCGYTILILHHTPKSNDKIYKGSTVIFDLCDHNLSLHKVRKGCYTPEEDEGDDDTDNYCYRLGTQGKTRYEPFHIFLEFDTEKGCFILAPDPDIETLEEIYSLLVGKEPLKTSDVFELVKKEIGIKGKGKLTYLLRKGIGKYWTSESQGRGKPTYYKATNPVFPLYIPRPLDYPKTTSPDKKDHPTQKRLDSPDFIDQSSSPAHSQTSWTGQEITSPNHFERPRPVQTSQIGQNDAIDLNNLEVFEVEIT